MLDLEKSRSELSSKTLLSVLICLGSTLFCRDGSLNFPDVCGILRIARTSCSIFLGSAYKMLCDELDIVVEDLLDVLLFALFVQGS